MLTGIYQSGAILVIAIVFYAMDSWLIHRYDKFRAQGSGSSRSLSYTVLAVVMGAVLIAQPVLWPWLGIQTTAAWGLVAQAAGAVLIFVALALHWWARTTLQHYYGEREEVQPGQRLVYAGPYVYIRHPLYTSYFALIIGILLINPALTTLLATAYIFWDFWHATKREEKLLSEQLPGYADYMARTSRFLPRLAGRQKDK